jgi:putative oxidoreductase
VKQLEDIVYATLRILAGTLFVVHGLQKLFGVLGGHQQAVGSQLWIGAIIELVGGVLVAGGLFTRVAAFVCSGQMAVAYFQFHWKLDVSHYRWLPMINGGEDTVLYCFLFLLFSIRGAGPYSLDRSWRNAG